MMTTEADMSRDALSPQGLEALLRLLVGGSRQRIGSAVVDGRMVWIKRFAAPDASAAKWLHAALSPLLPHAFLRSSPLVDAGKRADREARKTEAFRAAGLPALDILYRNADVLVFGNASRIVETEHRRLSGADPVTADQLLVDCGTALGRAHAAGLVHGRPHPRDMFVVGDEIGFLDFEEEPESVMPLAMAQARDAWLLFQQITSMAIRPDTSERAFAAYRRLAPAEAIVELRTTVDFFARLLGPLNILGRLLGNDVQRAVKSTQFLKTALTPPAGGDARQAQDSKDD